MNPNSTPACLEVNWRNYLEERGHRIYQAGSSLRVVRRKGRPIFAFSALNECRSCRFTGAANFCNSLHILDLSIVGHADPDTKIC